MRIFRETLLLTVLFSCAVFGQEITTAEKAFRDYTDARCKTEKAIIATEACLEADDLERAGQWLNVAKKENGGNDNPVTQYQIHSLQSELFYYLGLYEFGAYEAQKGIVVARPIRDSLLLSDGYFFKGINYFEMAQNDSAMHNLRLSEKFYPSKRKKLPRTIITDAHIYNNIAQTYFKLKQPDSALFYNRKAYKVAINSGYKRVISNAEQIFGEIYLKTGRIDSAKIYLNRSVASGMQNKFYDIALLSIGYLMQCDSGDNAKVLGRYNQGLQIISKYNVNTLYKKYFLETALEVFLKTGDHNRVVELQQQLLEIGRETDSHKNFYLQSMIGLYMKNENSLLTARINDLNQERNINLLQLVAALLGMAILLAIVIIFRRKNKLQQSLLDQKNEISKDLHDDIGSELSSILINTNLLISNYDTTEKQKNLLEKINDTGTEISQRLNAFIWSLNTENNSVSNFSEYVNQYASKLFDGTETQVDFSGNIRGAEHRMLNGYFRKNLFFSIKEALNNALKHSGATKVVLSIASPDKKELLISISDNGSGLQKQNNFGNGIRNIEKRIHGLKGTVRFENSAGFTVTISVPFPQQ